MSLYAAELRLRAGVYQPVRTRRVASADDSLTMIMCSASLKGCARQQTWPSMASRLVQPARLLPTTSLLPFLLRQPRIIASKGTRLPAKEMMFHAGSRVASRRAGGA
jgi:hypothetical protein